MPTMRAGRYRALRGRLVRIPDEPTKQEREKKRAKRKAQKLGRRANRR